MKGATMRFAAVIQHQQPPRDAVAMELIRRLFTRQPAPPSQRVPVDLDELPAALDERVRLVGEW
jgi:hypothetical protein